MSEAAPPAAVVRNWVPRSPYIVVHDESEPSTYCCHRIVHRGIPCNHCPLYASPFELRADKDNEEIN